MIKNMTQWYINQQKPSLSMSPFHDANTGCFSSINIHAIILSTIPMNPCSLEGIHDGTETGDENGVKQDGRVE